MEDATQERYRMTSIPPSDICELARWLLKWAGFGCREEFHAALLSFPVPPVLTSPTGVVVKGKGGIVEHVDQVAPPGRKVFGETEADRQANRAFLRKLWWRLEPIGVYVYNFALPRKAAMLPVVTHGVPPGERALVEEHYGLWSWALIAVLSLGCPAYRWVARWRVERGLVLIETELAKRGAPFLAGNQPGGLDVVVSALLSPLTFPDTFGGQMPPLDAMPDKLQADVRRTRSRPAGRLVLATYAAVR